MNTSATIDDMSDKTRNGMYRVGKDAKEAKDNIKRTASSELGNLIADVEDLLKKVTNVTDADVAQLRARLENKIETAKETLASGTRQVAQTAREAAKATDDYVRTSPWQAIGIAAIVGAAFGYVFSRR